MLNESMGMCLPTRLITKAELPDIQARPVPELAETLEGSERT